MKINKQKQKKKRNYWYLFHVYTFTKSYGLDEDYEVEVHHIKMFVNSAREGFYILRNQYTDIAHIEFERLRE